MKRPSPTASTTSQGPPPAPPESPEAIARRKRMAHLLAVGGLRAAARRDPDPVAEEVTNGLAG